MKVNNILSDYNREVLKSIIVKSHKIFKYDAVNQVDENEFMCVATKKVTGEKRVLYISNGKLIEVLNF